MPEPSHRRSILYAPGIHTGGGFVLLQDLLDSADDCMELEAFLDLRARERVILPPRAKVYWIRNGWFARVLGEIALRRAANEETVVLALHGFPPLLRIRGKFAVFLQNKLFLGLSSFAQFRLKTRLRLSLAALLFWFTSGRVTRYIVQTPTMRRELREFLGAKRSCEPVIEVWPFVELGEPPTKTKQRWDFVYVADGEAHKNHRNLLAAWRLLADEGCKPTLALTLSERDVALRRKIERQRLEGELQIEVLGHLDRARIMSVYAESRALIFPSFTESFGLPLLEARSMGLPIIASELDYVRDVCDPVETFDPTSPVSIARAVKRFIGKESDALKPSSAAEFWRKLSECRWS